MKKPPKGMPVLRGLARRSELGGHWLLVVYCPACNKTHQHGWGGDEKPPRGTIAHRHAHCTDEGGRHFRESGYYIGEFRDKDVKNLDVGT